MKSFSNECRYRRRTRTRQRHQKGQREGRRDKRRVEQLTKKDEHFHRKRHFLLSLCDFLINFKSNFTKWTMFYRVLCFLDWLGKKKSLWTQWEISYREKRIEDPSMASGQDYSGTRRDLLIHFLPILFWRGNPPHHNTVISLLHVSMSSSSSFKGWYPASDQWEVASRFPQDLLPQEEAW